MPGDRVQQKTIIAERAAWCCEVAGYMALDLIEMRHVTVVFKVAQSKSSTAFEDQLRILAQVSYSRDNMGAHVVSLHSPRRNAVARSPPGNLSSGDHCRATLASSLGVSAQRTRHR